jgi:hypothetical protein
VTIAWIALLAGIVTGWILGHRYPVLLWPSDWLPAIRLRRQHRRMTDPGDKTRS